MPIDSTIVILSVRLTAEGNSMVSVCAISQGHGYNYMLYKVSCIYIIYIEIYIITFHSGFQVISDKEATF